MFNLFTVDTGKWVKRYKIDLRVRLIKFDVFFNFAVFSNGVFATEFLSNFKFGLVYLNDLVLSKLRCVVLDVFVYTM